VESYKEQRLENVLLFPSLNDAISDLRIPATTTWNAQMVPTAVLMAAEGSVWTPVVNLQEHKEKTKMALVHFSSQRSCAFLTWTSVLLTGTALETVSAVLMDATKSVCLLQREVQEWVS